MTRFFLHIYSKKTIAVLLFLSVVLSVLPFPQQARALGFFDTICLTQPANPLCIGRQGWNLLGGAATDYAGDKILDLINYILGKVNSLLAYLAGLATQLVEWAIEESTDQLSNVDTIQRGWKGARDITNLFFIFVLLVIAIATILRRESYNMKRLLPTLVIVALFINFSLLITQLVILPTNLFGEYFVDLIKEEAGTPDLKTALGKTVFMSSLLGSEVDEADLEDADKIFLKKFKNPENKTVAGLNLFIIQVVVMIMLLWFVYVMVALVFVITLRTIVLMILMVLSPIAFFFHVLPGTASYAHQWWTALIKQSIMLPATLFFVWIAVLLAQDLPGMVGVNVAGNSPLFNSRVLYVLVLVLFFLSASLIVAQKLGGQAAGIAINGARRLRGFVTGGIAGGAVAAGGLAAYYTTRKAAEMASKSDTMRRLAGESAAVGAVQQRLEKHAEPRKKIAERQSQYQKQYMQSRPVEEQAEILAKNMGLAKDLSPRDLASIVTKTKNPETRQALESKLTQLEKISPEKYDKYLEERGNAERKMGIQTMPERFASFSKATEEEQKTFEAIMEQTIRKASPVQQAQIRNLAEKTAAPGKALTESEIKWNESVVKIKDAYQKTIDSYGRDTEEVASTFEALGNRAAAHETRANPTFQKILGLSSKESIPDTEAFPGGPISGSK